MEIRIEQIVDILGLERERRSQKADSFNVRCPFCNDHKYHLNINTAKGVFNCPRCSTGGGKLDLYSLVRFGRKYIKGDREVFHRLLEEIGEDNRNFEYKKERNVVENKYEAILPPSDNVLHEAYGAVLRFKPFALSEEHRQNLLDRGLREEDIERNEYRTIPAEMPWIKGYKKALKVAEIMRKPLQNRGFNPSIYHIAAGVLLADHLAGQGYNLKGVPGFYKLCGHWGFNLSSGMLIPTRNMNGEVVGLQVRVDKGNVRYLTVSSKGLPEGATENISRTHFPLGNPVLRNKGAILLTEGPLKADVARLLMGGASPFMALQGVNNTRDLSSEFQSLKEMGVSQVVEMFDMDKVINPNVSKASKKIEDLAHEAEVDFTRRYWALDECERRYADLLKLAAFNGIQVPEETGNVVVDTVGAAQALYASGKVKDYFSGKALWDPSSKGIDDYLLKQMKAKEEQEAKLVVLPNKETLTENKEESTVEHSSGLLQAVKRKFAF
ncbi:hypothetical protein ACLGL1_06935 [Peptococcus simiae]|uniref:hypothetical protein n=1 Tax=Peptococcus simiae TaxID=1643805 RepID=UPI0039810A61